MRLLLKDFQEDAVDQLVTQLRLAAREVGASPQAVTLSAPTGSGKTAIITAAIERVIEGDAEHEADAEAAFLWISDQPELNQQTRSKILEASSVLGNDRLILVDSTFDEERFDPGRVFFLNTQKLGRDKQLVTRGDERTHTVWDTISRTAEADPASFYVVIDEAHRGMRANAEDDKVATTIIQKFIKGSDGEIPPIRLVAGMSATPDRFHTLLQGTSRTTRPVAVGADEVRDSGLLKDVITLYHPTDAQPTDITMLREAARALERFRTRWDAYCREQGEPPVHPILVVQVQDGTDGKISRTDIGEAIQAINEEIGPLPDRSFAHAFQEAATVAIDSHQLRYLAPSHVEQDPEVQVVFFKTSLNTGWDCPRAEVMMSFRTAVDATVIAQLVGRVVRTPLARRIDTDEFLNTVSLYLPHYDSPGLQRVIDRLTADDPDAAPVSVERGEDVALLTRDKDREQCFEAASAIPSYTIPRQRRTSESRRLMKLARLLSNDDLNIDAPEHARDELVGVLLSAHERLRDTENFKRIVDKTGRVRIRGVALHYEADPTTDEIEIEVSRENVDDLFSAAGRKLGEGLHKAYRKARVIQDPSAKSRSKLEAFALCADADVARSLDERAKAMVREWLEHHASAIYNLRESQQQEYNEIRRLASEPELVPILLPDRVEWRSASTNWERHLYVTDAGTFPAALNGWETQVVEAEMERSEVVGWLRNPPRKPWAVCVPYLLHGEHRAMYPDFIVFRQKEDQIVADLLDPHSIELADAPAKAAGLARYAARHAHHFGRIELILIENREVRRLDLTDEDVRDAVKGVSTQAHLRELFGSR